MHGVLFALLLTVILDQPEPSGAGQSASPSTTAKPGQNQEGKLPVKPPPVETGVVPLPQGAPPTGLQMPVPSAVQPLPKPEQTLQVSPDLNAVNGLLRDHALTIQEAVAVALYTNREFAASLASLLQAQGRRGQVRAALNPTFGINGELTFYDAPTTADFAAFSTTPGQPASNAPAFVITPEFNPTISTAISLPLDIGGTLRAAISQAQFQEVAARIDINRVRNQIVFNVKNAFYNVLRAQAQIAVATDNLNNALTRLNNANQNYAAGTSPRFDVISAQRDVADAQQGVINARAQLSVNMAALKNTMGIGIGSRLRISDQNAVETPPGVVPPALPPVVPSTTTPPPNPIETPPPKTTAPIKPVTAVPVPSGEGGEVEDTFDFGPEYAALLQEALRTRPEILESDAQIAAARRGVQYARRSNLPSLNLGVSDIYSPNAAGFTRRNIGALTLGISIPIFDGGLARAREQEARGQVANAQTNRRQAVDTTQVEVQQAYIALVQARNRVAVANVGLTQAREAFRLAQVRYNTGVSQQTGISPQLELSNAQTTLAQAQSNQINALYDYNTARAQVDRAVGRYAFTAAAPGYSAPPSEKERGVSR